MSLRDCIINARSANEITEDQADEALEIYEQLEVEYEKTLSPGAAEAQAAKDAFAALQRNVAERKRAKLLQARAYQRALMDANSYRTITGEPDFGKGVEALLEQDTRSTYSSIVQRERAIKGLAMGRMDGFLATFRRNIVGTTRNKAQLLNMAKEVFKEETGDELAKQFARAWADTSEYLRKRFNAAGGKIPKREDWGLPQVHDFIKVRSVSAREWIDYILPRLDKDKMIDETTGLRMTDEALEIALNDVYQTIGTQGYSKVQPSGVAPGRKLANRRTDHRFLVFKDANSWLEYQQRFGNENVFDTMIAHITNMSRDIAALEVLGPNPNATLTFLKQNIRKEAAGDSKLEAKAANRIANIDAMYLAYTGGNNQPVNGFFANTFAGLRQVLTSIQLGSASIAAVTDLNFQRLARQHAGLPQAKTIKQYLDFLSPLSAEEKGRLAVRLGLIAEHWSTLAAAQMRYVGDISGPEITRRMADFVMRASFLSPFTQAGKWAFGMEFLGAMADNTKKAFDDLDPDFRRTLQEHGIEADRWDIIRTTDLYEYEGATFLRAEDIEARTDIRPEVARELATRVLEMVDTQTNFAVPSHSLRGRVALTGETRPGTIAGELTRSFAMYKNFGVTLIYTHIMRGMNQSTVKGKGQYFADLVISTTLMGALALQLKEISKGRDPRPMTGEGSTAFWQAAAFQGGGLGIFGDFLFSDQNRFGGGLEETIAGPVVGFASDVGKLTVGNLHEAAKGEETKAAKELVDFASRYTPGSSIWYARLATERLIFDELKMMTDPQARQNMRRLERRFQREFGQKYWWRPGTREPQRAPDISAAVGD